MSFEPGLSKVFCSVLPVLPPRITPLLFNKLVFLSSLVYSHMINSNTTIYKLDMYCLFIVPT
jgi:hypothetical protein